MEESFYDYIGVLDASDAAEDAAGGKVLKSIPKYVKEPPGWNILAGPCWPARDFFRNFLIKSREFGKKEASCTTTRYAFFHLM